MRPLDADKLKKYKCSICDNRERCEDTEQVCSEIAEIDEQPTINVKQQEDIANLIEMYIENISEKIEKTTNSIARLEGALTELHIEKSRLIDLQKLS